MYVFTYLLTYFGGEKTKQIFFSRRTKSKTIVPPSYEKQSVDFHHKLIFHFLYDGIIVHKWFEQYFTVEHKFSTYEKLAFIQIHFNNGCSSSDHFLYYIKT